MYGTRVFPSRLLTKRVWRSAGYWFASSSTSSNPIDTVAEFHNSRQGFSKWRKSLEMPVQSPFTPVSISRESLHHKLLRAIWQHSNNDKQHKAFISAKESSLTLSYRNLFIQSQSVASFLNEQGFKKRDVAAIVLPNYQQWVAFALGVWSTGGVVSGASNMFTDMELEHQFIDAQCKAVLTDTDSLDRVLHAARNCSKIKTVICVRSNKDIEIPPYVTDWDDVLRAEPCFNPIKVNPEDICLLPYSSGTTGSPKGVMLSHRAISTMCDVLKTHINNEVMPALGFHNYNWKTDHQLTLLPLYHIYGIVITLVNLLNGCSNLIFHKFDPQLFCQTIEKYQVSTVYLVPPIVVFLAKSPLVNNYDLSSLRFLLVAAAATGEDVLNELKKRFPHIVLSQGYGMTEVGCASHLPLMDGKQENNVGLPASGFEQKIVDIETGKELGFNEVGEIWLRSPTLMTGYLNKPEVTRETIDKQGWLRTGDIGYNDENGHLFIVDRIKELIKVKGLQVAPNEVENVLLSHPLVADTAVIGIPDEKAGELVRAYVVRSAPSLTEDQVRHFVAHKLAPHKHITGGVVFIDQIPKSASGKILRRFLRDAAKEVVAK